MTDRELKAEPRVRPPADLEREVLDHIAGSSARDKIFPTKAKGVLFAGALGFHLGKPEPVKSFGEGIRLEYFEEEVKIIDIIAIAHFSDLKIIGDDRGREAIQIFEQYVHRGLIHIRDVCFSGQRTPMDGILMMLTNPPGSDTDEALPGLI